MVIKARHPVAFVLLTTGLLWACPGCPPSKPDKDAGSSVLEEDAATPVVEEDGGSGEDGGEPDAAVEEPDAAVEEPDAAVEEPDAAVEVPDAAVEVPDASIPDAAAPRDASTRPDGSLRIGTYNVRRFFDTVCHTDACGGGDDYEELPTQYEFDSKADNIVSSIRTMSVDLVILQEIETQTCVDALMSRLTGTYSHAVLGEINVPASVDVAVLANLPWLETHKHKWRYLYRADGGRTTFSREFLEVHFDWQGRRVIVFAAHFRSKSNDDPERRLLEARMARTIMDEVVAAHPDALVVLGGDLNDEPGSAPLRALESDGGLLRVASELPDQDEATYYYNGDGQALDHLYLARNSAGTYVLGSAQVVRSPGKRSLGYSDHAALKARFSIR